MSDENRNVMPSVMLVDPDPLGQEIVKAMLEHCGCRVHVVGNGPEAVDAFTRQSFEMIFMECYLPGIDGYQAAGMIRNLEAANPGKNASGRRTPIVCLAASSMESGRERIPRAEMDDFLSKPYRIADLQAMLDKWLPVGQAEKHSSVPGFAEDHPAIDEEALKALASLQPQGAKALLTRLITVYFDSSSKQLKNILDAIKDHDVDSLLTAAHTLKSSSASLGARDFAEQCKELEMMARSGEIDGAEARVAPLEGEYRRVREFLNRYLTSLE